jgi:hypothetical protein
MTWPDVCFQPYLPHKGEGILNACPLTAPHCSPQQCYARVCNYHLGPPARGRSAQPPVRTDPASYQPLIPHILIHRHQAPGSTTESTCMSRFPNTGTRYNSQSGGPSHNPPDCNRPARISVLHCIRIWCSSGCSRINYPTPACSDCISPYTSR